MPCPLASFLSLPFPFQATANFTFRSHVWRYFEDIPLKAAKHETQQERLEREIFETMLSPDPRRSIARPAILE